MSTVSYDAIYTTLRNRLMNYTDGVTTMASLVGGPGDTARIFQNTVPDVATFPYIVFRITSDDDSNMQSRIQGNIEIMVYDRPRSQMRRQRTLSDLVDKALRQFGAGSTLTGYFRITGRTRGDVPQGSGEADREVVTTRFLFTFFAWPHYLNTAP